MTPEEYEQRMRKLVARIDAETAWQRLLAASVVWAMAALVAAFGGTLGWGPDVRWTAAAVAVMAVGDGIDEQLFDDQLQTQRVVVRNAQIGRHLGHAGNQSGKLVLARDDGNVRKIACH